MRARTTAKRPVLQASTKDYGVMNSRIHSLTRETKSDIAIRELNNLFEIN